MTKTPGDWVGEIYGINLRVHSSDINYCTTNFSVIDFSRFLKCNSTEIPAFLLVPTTSCKPIINTGTRVLYLTHVWRCQGFFDGDRFWRILRTDSAIQDAKSCVHLLTVFRITVVKLQSLAYRRASWSLLYWYHKTNSKCDTTDYSRHGDVKSICNISSHHDLRLSNSRPRSQTRILSESRW